MILFRKTACFKIISMVLVFLFVFQADLLLSRGENLQERFDTAKKNYTDGNYERAAYQFQKLTEAYQTVQDQSEETKTAYGQALLLLGACHEKMGQPEAAEENYRTARKLLGTDLVVPGVYLEDLSIFQKPGGKKTGENRVIQKEVKKKKKFPWLLVAGGAVVVVVALLLLKKSKKSEPPKTANIDITFSPNPVYSDSSGYWSYQIILKETNGVGVTLTEMDYSPGTWNGGTPEEFFGTDFLSANGTLTGYIQSWGYSDGSVITVSISGDDANGHKNLTWSGTVTLRKSSNQSLSPTASSSLQERGGTGTGKE